MQIIKSITEGKISGEKLSEIQKHIDDLEIVYKAFNEGRTEAKINALADQSYSAYRSSSKYYLTPEVAKNEIIESLIEHLNNKEQNFRDLANINSKNINDRLKLERKNKTLENRNLWQRIINKKI